MLKIKHLASADKQKLLLLFCSVFMVAASYALLRPLKITIFYHIVGKDYYPFSKMLMFILAIPSMAIYSKIVDLWNRQTVLYILFSVYIILGLLFAYLFLQPATGLANTVSSPHRVLGWLFLIAMDFFPTFVIGPLWAFINSSSTPKFAQESYGFLIAGTKLGGIIACLIGFFTIQEFAIPQNGAQSIAVLVAAAAGMIFIALLFIKKIITSIPPQHLIGYSEQHSNTAPKPAISGFKSMFEGLKCIIQNPYVFGIFLLFFCYDIIFTIVEYQATVLLSITKNNSAHQMSHVLFLSALISQIIGLCFALFVPTILTRINKMHYALLVLPIITFTTIIILICNPTLFMLLCAITILPAINFGFNTPIREMLFIPTAKEIQFKSKAWIDSFGRSLSKTSGSTINAFFYNYYPSMFLSGNFVVCLGLTGCLALASYIMGRAYTRTITQKTIIRPQ